MNHIQCSAFQGTEYSFNEIDAVKLVPIYYFMDTVPEDLLTIGLVL